MVALPPEAATVSACLGQLEACLADPASAVTTLADVPPAILEAALRSLTQRRSREALPLLRTLADQAPTKEARKLARRALYRLAQSGLQLPVTTPKPVVGRQPERPLRAWGSGIDGRGSRAVWILFDKGYGGWVLCSLIINDQAGILEVAGGAISKKRLEAELKTLRDRQNLPWVEIPGRRAVGLVVEAIEHHDPSNPLPPEFARWRHLFAPETGTRSMPDLSPLEGIGAEPALVGHSAELLALPEAAGWFLDPQAVQADAVELLQARESRLVVSEQIKAEREAAIVDRVIERELSREAQQLWARRLTEMAWVFHATGRTHQARIAYATALALEEAARRPSHIPFVRALAQRGLELACEVALGRVSASEVSRAPRQVARSS